MLTAHRLSCAVVSIASAILACDARNNDPVEEAKTLATLAPVATREGDRLTLRLLTGAKKTLTNVTSCAQTRFKVPPDATCEWSFELKAYDRARHLFVVNVYYSEGKDDLLVDDRTGLESTFDGRVALSPSGGHALEIVTDSYDQGGPEIRLWRRGRMKFVRQWTGAPGFDGDRRGYDHGDINYRVLNWPSEHDIEVEVAMAGGPQTYRLARDRRRWTIRPAN